MPLIGLAPASKMPVFWNTAVRTRGSFAAAMACSPPQLKPDTAICPGSMRPWYGLPARAFSFKAQSMAWVSCAVDVFGGGS